MWHCVIKCLFIVKLVFFITVLLTKHEYSFTSQPNTLCIMICNIIMQCLFFHFTKLCIQNFGMEYFFCWKMIHALHTLSINRLDYCICGITLDNMSLQTIRKCAYIHRIVHFIKFSCLF